MGLLYSYVMVFTEVQAPALASIRPTQVTDVQLHQFAELIYRRTGIRIAGLDVGGVMGRHICFELATGRVTVESVGLQPQTI